MSNAVLSMREWDKPENGILARFEYRGGKVEDIHYSDKKTGKDATMAKYAIAAEFSDGQQILLEQLGRDYKGPYPFEKGKTYEFRLTSYNVERGQQHATFDAVREVRAATGQGEAAPSRRAS